MYWFSSNYLKWLHNNHLIFIMVSREQEFWCYNAWGLRWKTWKIGHGIIWRVIPSSVSQVLRVSWGCSWGYQGNTSGGLYMWHESHHKTVAGLKLLPLWQCPVAAASMVRDPWRWPSTAICHRGRGDGGRDSLLLQGLGTSKAATASSGRLWRGLEFCETQPWVCPWAPQLTCRQGQVLKGLGEKAETRCPPHCPEDHCQADWTRTLPR